jgi:hypothetical protein
VVAWRTMVADRGWRYESTVFLRRICRGGIRRAAFWGERQRARGARGQSRAQLGDARIADTVSCP